jgi:outer membrane usher protein FimD/PapC
MTTKFQAPRDFSAYEYYNRRFRGRLAMQGFSEGYRTLTDTATSVATSRRKLNLLAGIGYVTPQLGSFGLDFARSESYNGSERETLTFSWSRRIWKRTYANATLRQIRDTDTRHEAGVNLTWYLGRDHSISGALRREGDANIQQLEARRNIPNGIGTGWSVRGRGQNRTRAKSIC